MCVLTIMYPILFIYAEKILNFLLHAEAKILLRMLIQYFYLLFWDEPMAKVQKNFYIFFIRCISFLTISAIFFLTYNHTDYNSWHFRRFFRYMRSKSVCVRVCATFLQLQCLLELQ